MTNTGCMTLSTSICDRKKSNTKPKAHKIHLISLVLHVMASLHMVNSRGLQIVSSEGW